MLILESVDLAPKVAQTTSETVPSTEPTTAQTPPKPATSTPPLQQQVAVPKRKRRDRIPERPNYRFVCQFEHSSKNNSVFLVSIYGVS